MGALKDTLLHSQKIRAVQVLQICGSGLGKMVAMATSKLRGHMHQDAKRAAFFGGQQAQKIRQCIHRYQNRSA